MLATVHVARPFENSFEAVQVDGVVRRRRGAHQRSDGVLGGLQRGRSAAQADAVRHRDGPLHRLTERREGELVVGVGLRPRQGGDVDADVGPGLGADVRAGHGRSWVHVVAAVGGGGSASAGSGSCSAARPPRVPRGQHRRDRRTGFRDRNTPAVGSTTYDHTTFSSTSSRIPSSPNMDFSCTKLPCIAILID